MKRISNGDQGNRRNALLRKVALGGLSVVMVAGTVTGFAGMASALEPDHNTPGGGSSPGGFDGGGVDHGNHSDDDNQDERDRKAAEEKARKEREAAALREHQNRENKPQPNQPPSNQLADNGAANDQYYFGSGGTITDTIHGPIITFDGPGMDGVQSGNVGLQGKPANDPVNRKSISAPGGSNCNFHSGSTNLEVTRKMFPAKGCGPWSPYLHKCDYSSKGWHCYFQ